jgi:hypothetical protein
LGLGVSIAFVIAVLNLIQRYPENAIETIFGQNEKTNQTDGGRLRVTKWQTGKQYLYVFGNLLSQGFILSKLISIVEVKDTGAKFTTILTIRWFLPIKMATLPTSRWGLDPGRFLLRPGLHIHSHHLRSDTSTPTADYFCLRHS